MSAVITASAMPEPKLNRPMITISIMLATVIQAIDGTIANVALPHMQGSLNASQDQITWVLTSFIVAAAIATPLTGWLSDRFGLKRLFLVSIAGFTLASVFCGIAGNLSEIVLARMMQGVFGAALVPLSQATLLDINPREKHGQAMAVWGMGVMVGPILGPTLGGWLTDAYDWRWCFFINVPIGAAALFGVWTYFPRDKKGRGLKFDIFGFYALSIGIGALQMLLDRGQQNDWFSSGETWIEAILALLSICAFIIHTATLPAGKSFLDYRLLLNRNFITGLFFIFIVGMVLFATRALMPSMLQGLMGYMVQALQVANTQKAHAGLVANLPPDVQNGSTGLFGPISRGGGGLGSMALNGEITRQASMIAYVDNFQLMLILTLLCLPLLMIIQAPKKKASQAQEEQIELAAME